MLKLRIVVTFGMLLVLAGCTTNGTRSRVPESHISSSARTAPSDVREEFRSRFPDAELISVIKVTYKDGTGEHKVEYSQGGQKRNALIIVTPGP